ncbi:MSC domain-containing protein [Mycena indigotica]|uniref:MSC domain-containing protein n=1 Tax=Mycena indigotica TaxID=2126181 RepID=A0A8H6S8N9_9AGAR|nr:MSC domain-containing protein [Mycena indigotica]KAF7294966.1 MSC domain-containing protein [Mycena indigotica]
MSRPTAAEIVRQGHYLEPDFDPASLTVSQLLGVFGFHGIAYPTPYSKTKLINLFNAEIKSKASKLRTARLKAASSIASDDGITDGVTGEPLTAAPQPVRRSSRRLSRAPTEEPEPAPAPKRRRSSAQPNLGGPSRKAEPVEPALVEESEPEEEELPVRKIGRKKTQQTAGQQSRRVSHPEDSAWEDNNVFQSGAESSSPARPKPTRKSIAPKKKRKSVSAPPEVAPSSSPPRPRAESPFSPPQSKFTPEFPSNIKREMRLMSPKLPAPSFSPLQTKVEHDETFDNGESDYPGDGPTEDFGLLEEDEEEDEEAAPEDEYNAVISRKIAQGGVDKASTKATGWGIIIRVMLFLFSLASSYAVWGYKSESSLIGYCNKNQSTNQALEHLRAKRHAVEVCHRDNQTLADGSPCPLPEIPFLHPDTCTPCPAHGRCTQFHVTCDAGYLLEPHPLLFFVSGANTPKVIEQSIRRATDGLPGLGSIGLPPHCAEDRRVNWLGRAAKKELGETRGRRLCQGDTKPLLDAYGGEARRWGYEESELAKVVSAKIPKEKAPSNFKELFTEAIQQLTRFEEIIIGEDVSSKQRFVALKTPALSWDCKIIVQSRAVWTEWQLVVYAIIGVTCLMLYGRHRRTQNATENAKVAELVQTALDTLKEQDRAYHSDPLSASVPYLSSLQLRDVVLADEHSVSRRTKLWSRVEKVVEGNANVRVNLEEVDGGDEMRVWRWIGAASPTK